MRRRAQTAAGFRRNLRWSALLALLVLGSCSGDEPTGVGTGRPAALLIEGGQDQSAVVGSELGDALTVRIVDAQNLPVRGQVVNFRVVSGGGSVFAGVAITTDSGVARERWTLGTVAADSQRVEARAVDATGNAIVFGVFHAAARPDAPASIAKVAGDSQFVEVGSPAADSLAVRVVDRYGNPTPNTPVLWAVSAGGGTLSADSTNTDAEGAARIRWTIGDQLGGVHSVTATVANLTAQTFHATAQPGAAVGVALAVPAAGASSGLPFLTAPQVRLVDSFGNTAVNSAAEITVTVSDSATLLGTSTATPVAGEATFTGLGLRGLVGEYTLTFSAAALPELTQTITLAAGVPSELVVVVQPAGAVSGAAFATQPMVALRDDVGNRTSSTVTVTVSVIEGDGTLQGTTAVAADSGLATFTDLRIDLAAVHLIAFAVEAPALTVLAESLMVAPGAPAQLAIVTPAGGARSGVAFTTQPVVEIRDAAGNRTTSSASVIASVTGEATLIGSASTTADNGVARFLELGLVGRDGLYTLHYATDGVEAQMQVVAVAGSPGSVVAGARFSCGLTTAGAAYCWGLNENGQLGDGTTVSRRVPQPVSGGYLFASLTAGGNHVCGLTAAGDPLCWGDNAYGQLGSGSQTQRRTPGSVNAGGVRFTQLFAGLNHTCGLTAAGQAYCWGGNSLGQLGDGTTGDKIVPVQVGGGVTFAVLSLGSGHTCGIASDGTAFCWGSNFSGQLGDGSGVAQSLPVPVATEDAFVAIAAGGLHTCAISTSQSTSCWGRNENGQLGDGTATQRSTPSPVVGGLTFESIAGGDASTCAVTTQRSLFCWGWNNYGQVGDGTVENRIQPAAVSDFGAAVSVSIGYSHTCALTSAFEAFCWGGNYAGQLGSGRAEIEPVPVDIAGGLSFDVIDAGSQQTCALTDAGSPYCWGGNTSGQLGDGYQENRTSPAPVQGGYTFASLAVGYHGSCGGVSTGEYFCWGNNTYRQLSDGSDAPFRTLPVLTTLGPTLSEISIGAHGCGLDAERRASCWGLNNAGQVGDGTTTSRAAPVRIVGDLEFSSVVVHGSHSCGVSTAGEIFCWGANSVGQLGDGTTVNRSAPVRAAATVAQPFAGVALGIAHTCALTTTGDAYCWGRNSSGQLGDGTVTSRVDAVRVFGSLRFTELVGGTEHSCGMGVDRRVYCWGGNQVGQLGDGTLVDRTQPTLVSTLQNVRALTSGTSHICAIADGGAGYCWGSDVSGQLGTGRPFTLTPQRVLGFGGS